MEKMAKRQKRRKEEEKRLTRTRVPLNFASTLNSTEESGSAPYQTSNVVPGEKRVALTFSDPQRDTRTGMV